MKINAYVCIRAKDGAILTRFGRWQNTIDNVDDVKLYDTIDRAGRYGLVRIDESDGKPMAGGIVELGRAVLIDVAGDVVAQCHRHGARVRSGF
jgi:hypothetical protein